MKKIIYAICGCLLIACNKNVEVITEDEVVVKELKLSTDNQHTVYTDDINYEFEILEGNGGYTTTVSKNEWGDDNAKVTFEKNKVKVAMLAKDIAITISDQKGKKRDVIIKSTAKSLSPISYGLLLNIGNSYEMKNISFGDGLYVVKRIKGNATEVFINNKGYVTVTALKPGNSYYKLTDQRGSTSKLDVSVPAVYELTGSSLSITAENDQISQIALKSGSGWQIVKDPQSPIISLLTVIPLGDINKTYDFLQINSTDKDLQGKTVINLKDNNGNLATINFIVKK